MPSPYVILAGVLAVLAALGGAFSAGWQARAILADKDALQAQNDALKGYADAAKKAADAADEYARKRDTLRDRVQVVRVASAPVIRELDRCPMPSDAGRLLNSAADAADGTDTGHRADAARSAPEQRKP